LIILDYEIKLTIPFLLGAYDRNNPEHNQVLNVSSYTMHPKYDPNDFPNDIAIVKLKRAIKFGNYARPVCLPRAKHIIPVGSNCYVTG